MGVHFPTVELDNATQFSTLSRMSGLLWHSSKWACRFGRFLQYTSGFEVLACSLDTDVNYVTTMLQLCLSLSKVAATFGGILKDRYIAPAALSPGTEVLC